MQNIEQELQEATERIKALEKEKADLKRKITETRKATACVLREMILQEAGLSNESKERLHKAFEHSRDNAGLKQAINVEKRKAQDSLAEVRQ